MANPYMGEIRIFAGNFAPLGWMFCNGQILPISQYDTLFNLIGTTYGGDGQNTFAIPDLRGRVPVHQSSTSLIAESGGLEFVALTTAQLPVHTHNAACNSADANSDNPTNNFWAAQPSLLTYTATGTANSNMKSTAIANTGNGVVHDNMVPFQATSYIIAVEGVFPSQ
ncbi:MAG: tail fiber protein [Ferruginibacter sp.]